MKRSPKGKGTTGSGGGGARNGWGRTRARVPARREDLIFGCVLVDLFRCCAERADEPAERTLYFLSHYHSDHTAGLGRTWRGVRLTEGVGSSIGADGVSTEEVSVFGLFSSER